MAAWTLTSTDAPAVPRLNYEGLTTVSTKFLLNAGASLSASDVILMARIPDQVTVVDWLIGGTAGGDGQVFKLGVGTAGGGTGGAGAAGETALAAAITFSATAQSFRRTTGATYKVSLSDDAMPQWTWVYLVRTSGTSTATASLQLTLWYGPDGVV